MKLMSIAMKPLCEPPFLTERIEEMIALMGGGGGIPNWEASELLEQYADKKAAALFFVHNNTYLIIYIDEMIWFLLTFSEITDKIKMYFCNTKLIKSHSVDFLFVI